MAEFSDQRLVAIYEAVNAYRPGTQPAFYVGLAAELGARSIIDLGCGTGLITRELARLGYDVVGVDPSSEMLEVARRQPDGDRVRWIHGDASQLEPRIADLAIMSGHVAQFFLTDEDWRSALLVLHRALKPGGCLAFESRNPEARDWESWTASAVVTAGGVDTWTTLDDFSDDVASCTNHYRFSATGEVLTSSVQLRFRSPTELTDSLAGAGFTVERMYGDWDRGPIGRTGPELVVVAVSSPAHG
ncbi:MAG: class I SAM-dependent methyltransferase [Actinobacteria bacterium]|nr:MAG: class I SAM-dependent methyltransferase [Actinomycetota bacterium]